MSSLAPAEPQASLCKHCDSPRVDICITPCSCMFHTRCMPLDGSSPINVCPGCSTQCVEVKLLPLDSRKLQELEQKERERARQAVNQSRKSSSASSTYSSLTTQRHGNVRTGKWNTQEIVYCELLMKCFTDGSLPILEGAKLHDFLTSVLSCKQSRLTKKFIHAKLSSKSYTRSTGWLSNANEAKQFSCIESDFIESAESQVDSAWLELYLQKEWRENFSRVCSEYNVQIDVTEWLDSWVEEMDRQSKEALEAAAEARKGILAATTAKSKSASKRPISHVINQNNPGQLHAASVEALTVLAQKAQQGSLSRSTASLPSHSSDNESISTSANAKQYYAPISAPAISLGDPNTNTQPSTGNFYIQNLVSVGDALTNFQPNPGMFNDSLQQPTSDNTTQINIDTTPHTSNTTTCGKKQSDSATKDEILALLSDYMPVSTNSPGLEYSQSFIALRLLLLKPRIDSPAETEALQVILQSYRSYVAGPRERQDVAIMLARDFSFLNYST